MKTQKIATDYGEKIAINFSDYFNNAPEVVVKSPGRINIMGEHTDYNMGFVLPAAINYYMYIGISKNDSQQINLYASDYDDHISLSINEIHKTNKSWFDLVLGVIDQLAKQINGVNIAFAGNVPEGAGVSSSAALTTATVFAISEIFKLDLSKWEMARLAQKSEHNFLNVQCGIMDQFACLFGLTNHILLLNCLTHEYGVSEIDFWGVRLLLLNSNVDHNLETSDYNTRREESSNAFKIIRGVNSKIKSYQDISLDNLSRFKEYLSEVEYQRALHVVAENDRVLKIKTAMEDKNFELAGQLLTEGHMSLKDNYEVTCLETDYLVETLNTDRRVFGARQVGGGFGGCVLAIVQDKDIKDLVNKTDTAYKKKFRKRVTNIPIRITKGCHRIN